MSVDLHEFSGLTGAIPFEKMADAEEVIESVCSGNIAVLATNRITNITHGTHLHNSYEFVITYSKMPSCNIDNRLYERKEGSLFAVNPMQEHGVSHDQKGFNLCGIHINSELVQSVAEDIYGSPNIVFSNSSFIAGHDLSMLVRLFLEELRYKQSGYEYIVDSLGQIIVGSLMRHINHNLSPKAHNQPKTNKESIKAAIDYMNENYSIGVSCSELANLIKMGKFGFIRTFKAETSKTPHEYLLDLKIEKAKKMLKSREYNITEISMMCGFSSHSHFTSTFRKKTGISPTEYRMNS